MRPYTAPILVLGLALATPPFAPAQDSQRVTPEMAWRLRVAAFKSLQAGTNIRVSLKDVGRKTGTVVTTGDSALSLKGPGRIPYAGIDSLWVRRNHAKVGALVGSLIGAVVAIAVMSGRTCNGGFSQLGDCTASRTLELLGITVGGAVVGAAVGSASPDWKPRYP